MIIKNLKNGTWEELYPKTTADNVYTLDGKSVQEKLNFDIPNIDIINYEEGTTKSKTLIINDSFFVMGATVTLDNITGAGNIYARGSCFFPFDNAETDYTATVTLASSSRSLSDTEQIYVRDKYKHRLYISTIGTYAPGDTVTVDVQVTGMLA